MPAPSPDDDKKVLNIFSDELDKITKAKQTETVETNNEVALIFQPLSQAKTDDDLAKIKDAATKVKQSCGNGSYRFSGNTTRIGPDVWPMSGWRIHSILRWPTLLLNKGMLLTTCNWLRTRRSLPMRRSLTSIFSRRATIHGPANQTAAFLLRISKR